MRLRTALFALLACALVRAEAFALYRHNEERAMWPPNSMIRVCWAPGINPEGGLQKRIRATVEGSWGTYSSIGFTDWGNCPKSEPKDMVGDHVIFIRRSSDRSFIDGSPGRKFTGGGMPFPTVMFLNFNAPARSFCDLGPGGNSNDDCVTWTAVHEFGHALGFKHEHARPDFPECAKSRVDPGFFFTDKKEGGGIELTSYDGGSLMNYCSTNGNNGGVLSPRDIIGFQEVYGMKPPASLVGPGGRCVDVDGGFDQDGTGLTLWECHEWDSQRWSWSPSEGTFRPQHAWDSCLDESTGATRPGGAVSIRNCDRRFVPRWRYDQFYVKGMGNRCIEAQPNGSVTYNGCGFGADYQWTYTLDHRLKRFRDNTCLTYGGFLSRTTMTRCDPNRGDQEIFLSGGDGSGSLVLANGLCLEVADNDAAPYHGVNTFVRVSHCSDQKLTQKFFFFGFFKGGSGIFLDDVPTDISRNGVRLIVDSNRGQPPMFELHFSGTEF